MRQRKIVGTRGQFSCPWVLPWISSCTHGDSDWGDLLTAYDGVAITYDEMGNPLSDGTWTYTWEHGRQLASMTNGSTTWTYTYDANGMRSKRTNGTDTYTYIYNGSKLMQMTAGSNVLTFTYDGSGNPSTVTLNGTTYYYITNLQGDVIEIRTFSGTKVCDYNYDAWGKVVSVQRYSSDPIAILNPLLYRGYVYDRDTGLYYLQSRYYNPEIGKFINADALRPKKEKKKNLPLARTWMLLDGILLSEIIQRKANIIWH